MLKHVKHEKKHIENAEGISRQNGGREERKNSGGTASYRGGLR